MAKPEEAPAPVPQESAAPSPETVKVKIVKSHSAYAYFVGDEASLPPADAAALIASGHAAKA